jgi:hypothetical protein
MPRRQIIVHIGRHKSGTSALQHYFADRRDRLAELGILYPLAGATRRIAHHDLARQCNQRLSDGADLPRIQAAMLAEITPRHDRIILSSEAFQNITDLSRLRDFLAPFNVGEIRVICYVREHLDYAVSGFRQFVQNQTEFTTFARHAARQGDMDRFVDRWQAFGRLSLNWYDRAALIDGDIIADVCHQLSIPPSDIPQRDINPSIGGNLLACKLAANYLGLAACDYDSLRDLAAHHARFRSAFRIPDADAARLRASSQYNASLFARLGPTPLKSWADCDPLPVTATLDTDIGLILPQSDACTRTRIADALRSGAHWFSLGAAAD